MTPATTSACPKCRKPLEQNSRFCANCGNDVSGVWSKSNPGALGGTIAVEVDPNVDTLGQLLSEETLGDYDIYGELGRGGMAAVYLGLDLALNRKVAIKTMLPELVSREGMVPRFKREAQTSAALSHPHIIQIFTVKETKKLVFFVMKFIEGRSLESVITDKGKVPLSMTQTILGQVGSALDYAHRKHVVHRDIKPANIMIDEDGWAIVTDFGIAKVQEAQNLTATGTAIGTPHYMSPEQFHNKSVTGQSDQYSLGVVLYEMLAGKKPFDGGTYAEIITQHLFEQVPDLRLVNPEVPEHVNEVVKRMMAKDPADRFPDLDTAIHALGTPASKKEGDVVRTQMISLAKSGPQKKLRMSVPMSPIPVTRKAPAAAATQIEERAPAKKGGAGKMIGISVGVLAVAGMAAFAFMNLDKFRGAPVSPPPALQPQAQAPGTSLPAASPQSTTEQLSTPVDSTPTVAAATLSAAELAKARTDSIRRADRAASGRRTDSLRIAKAMEQRFRSEQARTTKGTETKTGAAAVLPAAPPPVAEPQAPAPTPVGTVKIGSPVPGAVLYINGAVEAALSSIRTVSVPAGSVRITVKAEGCTPWDSIVTVPAGAAVVVGRRPTKCQP